MADTKVNADAKVSMELDLQTGDAQRTFKDFIDVQSEYTSKTLGKDTMSDVNTSVTKLRKEVKDLYDDFTSLPVQMQTMMSRTITGLTSSMKEIEQIASKNLG